MAYYLLTQRFCFLKTVLACFVIVVFKEIKKERNEFGNHYKMTTVYEINSDVILELDKGTFRN